MCMNGLHNFASVMDIYITSPGVCTIQNFGDTELTQKVYKDTTDSIPKSGKQHMSNNPSKAILFTHTVISILYTQSVPT